MYLIDLHGNVVHTWSMPYPPGLSGYLTERGTLFYNGRTSEETFLSRFPFKGGAVLEADWNGKVLWEVRHPDHHHHGRAIEVQSGDERDRMEVSGSTGGNFFSPRMGNAQRLPNGNTLICESSFGRFFEVTNGGEIVWDYVNPFFGRPFFAGSSDTQGNLVFRALQYSADEVARATATAGARIPNS